MTGLIQIQDYFIVLNTLFYEMCDWLLKKYVFNFKKVNMKTGLSLVCSCNIRNIVFEFCTVHAKIKDFFLICHSFFIKFINKLEWLNVGQKSQKILEFHKKMIYFGM